jgi:hypothetical protein
MPRNEPRRFGVVSLYEILIRRRLSMKKLLLAGLVGTVVALVPAVASAQHRMGDAVMGGVAGALVGGPVGAIAGGAIGYTAGPDIAHGMGIHHRHYRHYRHYRHHHYRHSRAYYRHHSH